MMNIIVGLLAGVAASMGFGGGFVLIIYMTAFAGVDQVTAQGVNLLFFLPVALVSLVIHQKTGLLNGGRCYTLFLQESWEYWQEHGQSVTSMWIFCRSCLPHCLYLWA